MPQKTAFFLWILIGFIVCGGALGETVPLDEAHFPDPVFRACLSASFDKNHDGSLADKERIATAMNVSNRGIASLQGIEYFDKLEKLYCAQNQLTDLNLNGNHILAELVCAGNRLTHLEVNMLPQLRHLCCHTNQLTALDLRRNPKIEVLSCEYNQLSALDVSACPALRELNCYENQLTELNLSGNPALTSLDCCFNQLTDLFLSRSPALVSLICSNNQLTDLDLSRNPALETVDCSFNAFRALNLKNNPKLSSLRCGCNQLTSLDLSANPLVTLLDCGKNRLFIQAVGLDYDLSLLPGFDPSRASDWQGGYVRGSILTVSGLGDVSYLYDCGNGHAERFLLFVDIAIPATPEPSMALVNRPGNVNGDAEGVVNGQDLLRLAQFIAGQNVNINRKAADVNGDGLVDGRDFLRLALHLTCQTVELKKSPLP